MKAKKNEIEPEFEFHAERMVRVPRQKRHRAPAAETTLRNCKVRVTMYLDADVVEHFKQRATRRNAAPYQRQINNALRQFLGVAETDQEYSHLLGDERFLEEVAKRVRPLL